MEEIRSIAVALYNNSSRKNQAAAKKFFKSIDRDCSGSISKKEFKRYLDKKCPKSFRDPTFFSLLDEDKNGSLDFEELLAFSYFINFRGAFCHGIGCRNFLLGVYFTCTRCFFKHKKSFDLCPDCFRKKNHHHKHKEFLDNYAIVGVAKKVISGESTLKKILNGMEAFNNGYQFGDAVAAAGGLCTIM